MLEIGLTGGIGSGKSTVATLLVAKGAVLIDADALVKELQAPGQPVFAAMVERFGAGIVRPDGSLDRPAVAAIVFADKAELEALNDIVHPAVTEEMTRRREALAHSDATIVLDIPLLVESRYENLGGVIVVDVEPEIAVARLVTGRGFSESDAWARVSAQASRADRVARADFLVGNEGSFADLEAQVEQCWSWVCSLPRPAPGSPVVPIRSGRAERD